MSVLVNLQKNCEIIKNVLKISSFVVLGSNAMNFIEWLKKALSSANNATLLSGNSSGGNGEGPRSTMAIQSNFNERASEIGYGIHQSSQKIAKLAQCESLMFHYGYLVRVGYMFIE